MRISRRKRTANRRNSLKSTGPKTSSGQRTSAQNAIRHGLSVPLPPQLVEPVQHQLVQLIMSDGFDDDEAHNLAEKIIDYDRNIEYLQKIYQDDIALVNDPGSKRGAAILEQEKRQEQLLNTLTDIEQLKFQVEDQKLLQALNLAKSAGKKMLRSKKNVEVDRITSSQRYFKRASNQLIKALRKL